MLAPIAIANHSKYAYLRIPVIGSDLDIAFEGADIWFKLLSASGWAILLTIFITIIIALILSWKKLPNIALSKKVRIVFASVGILYLFSCSFYNAFINKPSENHCLYSEYKKLGFFSAYSANLLTYITKTEYNQVSSSEADAIYKSHNIQADQIPNQLEKPDIIVIISESYFNPNLFKDVQYTPREITPISNKLRQSNPLNLYSPVFGGGTAAAEFEVLTGYPHKFLSGTLNPNIVFAYNHTIPTLPFYLKALGYQNLVICPHPGDFYQMNITMFNLGFDKFIPFETMSHKERRNKYWVGDDQMFLEAMDVLKENRDPPLLLYLLSMQNHAPYTAGSYDNYPQVKKVLIKPDSVKENIRSSIETFATGIRFSDQHMGEFIKFIEKRKRPTLLVFTPDHFPPLPYNDFIIDELYQQNNAFAVDNKPSLKRFNAEGFVYANYKLQKKPSSKAIPQYFLPTLILDWANLPKNNYFKFLDQVYQNNLFLHSQNTDPEENEQHQTKLIDDFKKLVF